MLGLLADGPRHLEGGDARDALGHRADRVGHPALGRVLRGRVRGEEGESDGGAEGGGAGGGLHINGFAVASAVGVAESLACGGVLCLAEVLSCCVGGEKIAVKITQT